jgi:archaellum component FlaG (FlaF/FlaG flagellin family)
MFRFRRKFKTRKLDEHVLLPSTQITESALADDASLIKPTKFKKRISLKLPSIKFPAIPEMPFLSFVSNRPPLRWLRKVPYRQISGFLILIVSILGFVVIVKNPMPWVESIFPIQITTPIFWIHLEQASVQSLLNALYADIVVLRIALGVMSFLAMFGLLLLVQRPITAIKALGRGIKRSPKTILYSPITFYRKVVKGRNWLLAKVEYLQSESAKWKTTFSILKSPFSLLRAAGFSPQASVALLFAGTTVGGGVLVNETVFAERSFARGDSGIYAASVIGNNAPLDIPTSYTDGDNTLMINLGNTPVREITIENVSVGTVFTGSALPSGEQNVVDIGGNVVTGGTNTRLEIGHMILENSRCKKLELVDINAHTINVIGNASDGQSIAPSPGTARMLAIGGGHHQADAMTTNGGTYDRIQIQAPTSAVNGRIGTLRLSNLYTKGGICALYRLTIGTLEILTNEIGMGDGFSTKEFSIATSVTGANITVTDNVEVTIAEPATN